MSLSRPARFPLLNLPWLCIECVIKSWNIVDIIFFALFSKKTRLIVKHLKIPLNGIRIFRTGATWIELDYSSREWSFRNDSGKESIFDNHKNSRTYPLVLRKNAIPLYTRKTDDYLESYTDGNEVIALKMAMEFLNELFKCSVNGVYIYGGDFPESVGIGVSSTMKLCVTYGLTQNQNQKLNLLLESLQVTGTCSLHLKNIENDFHVDPKIFKCRRLVFSVDSGAWANREILLQFEVPQLTLHGFQFSGEDIVSFVTQWFHSSNPKLEYLHIPSQDIQVSLETFRTEELNPLQFSERSHVPLTDSFKEFDFSEGLEIVRHDGLKATIHVEETDFLFYIWHNQ